MLKKAILLHFLPVFIIVSLVVLFTKINNSFFLVKTQVLKSDDKKLNRLQLNYQAGISSELNFITSIADKKNITILGSSEFTVPNIKYFPHDFLTDSVNLSVKSFGHAQHKSFSMYCQLLAAEPFLKNANICIILSPGWFKTEGTNIKAFLEFVPDNFLRTILYNDRISKKDKLEIAEFINSNFDLIEKPSLILKYYNSYYKYLKYPFLNYFVNLYHNKINNVKYDIQFKEKMKPLKVSQSLIKQDIKIKFVSGIKTNKLYVSDEYYISNLKHKSVDYLPIRVKCEEFKNQRELYDFKLLVRVLKKYNCKASFVLHPLNNYAYSGLHNYSNVKNKILKVCKENNFPILDLFVLSKKQFEPGVLYDFTHFGDYGWTKVNQFLYSTYYKSIAEK